MRFPGVAGPFPQGTIQCNIDHCDSHLPAMYKLPHHPVLNDTARGQPVNQIYLYIRPTQDAVGNRSAEQGSVGSCKYPTAILEELQRAGES